MVDHFFCHQVGSLHARLLCETLGINPELNYETLEILGNVGSARRLDYTVIGTEVNIAQRLASKATSSRIYITDKVLKDLEGKRRDRNVRVKDVGKMVLKGVQYSVQTFSVLGLEQETE